MRQEKAVMNHSAIRKKARKHLKGNWKKLSIIMIICALATTFLSLDSLSLTITNNPLLSEKANITVSHSSGWSWTGEAAYPESAGTTSNSYSLSDILRSNLADTGISVFDLIRNLPVDFRIVLAVLTLLTLASPMMKYGMVLNLRSCMRKAEPRISALFCWKILPKAALSELIITLPVVALGYLNKEVENVGTLSSALILIAAIFFMVLEYMWAMRYYIWTENPEMGLIDTLRKSRIHMRGHKFRQFTFQLTFIGWNILESFANILFAAVLALLETPTVVSVLILMLLTPWLSLYKQMGEMVFFDDILNPSETEPADDEIPSADRESVSARSANEAVAWSMLSSRQYSHQRLREENLWEEYQALGVHPAIEIEWLKKYSRFLCDEYTLNPGVLDDILRFASEYGDTFSINRVVNTLGRYVDHESQPPEILLEQCAKVVSAINSGNFDDHIKFVREKKELLSDMADRLEFRLSKTDPNGSWRDILAVVRAGCIE